MNNIVSFEIVNIYFGLNYILSLFTKIFDDFVDIKLNKGNVINIII